MSSYMGSSAHHQGVKSSEGCPTAWKLARSATANPPSKTQAASSHAACRARFSGDFHIGNKNPENGWKGDRALEAPQQPAQVLRRKRSCAERAGTRCRSAAQPRGPLRGGRLKGAVCSADRRARKPPPLLLGRLPAGPTAGPGGRCLGGLGMRCPRRPGARACPGGGGSGGSGSALPRPPAPRSGAASRPSPRLTSPPGGGATPGMRIAEPRGVPPPGAALPAPRRESPDSGGVAAPPPRREGGPSPRWRPPPHPPPRSHGPGAARRCCPARGRGRRTLRPRTRVRSGARRFQLGGVEQRCAGGSLLSPFLRAPPAQRREEEDERAHRRRLRAAPAGAAPVAAEALGGARRPQLRHPAPRCGAATSAVRQMLPSPSRRSPRRGGRGCEPPADPDPDAEQPRRRGSAGTGGGRRAAALRRNALPGHGAHAGARSRRLSPTFPGGGCSALGEAAWKCGERTGSRRRALLGAGVSVRPGDPARGAGNESRDRAATSDGDQLRRGEAGGRARVAWGRMPVSRRAAVSLPGRVPRAVQARASLRVCQAGTGGGTPLGRRFPGRRWPR
ncbi:translation initiation factor IF-2-like [Dryobates pubescens]|uniref:translation initiation factor IF-2-like n=1 Tax=Dryobates pubescens TaxID=118200 RepID=UPI0023B9CD58|nr:translation initiation factor IF-2-like [Dryobates pubescens]